MASSTKPPRHYHKKSRTGCQQCRARRVKCNEVHPVCGSCERYQVVCVYGKQGSSIGSEQAVAKPSKPSNEPSVDRNTSDTDPPESRERRVLELRLLHHYLMKTSWALLEPAEPAGKDLWTMVVPSLAFNNDALLYLIYAISALHLARTSHMDVEALSAYRYYLNLALRQHHRDLNDLSKVNADVVCLSSSLIRLEAFARLQDRPLEPYSPPSQWFQLTRGAGEAFHAAWNLISTDENCIAVRLLKGIPSDLYTRPLFGAHNRHGFLHLLQKIPTGEGNPLGEQSWDPEVQEAYESTCSYIGSAQNAIEENEEPAEICRRLMLFPIFIHARFIELVRERQSRALVILAHFFALIARFRDLWWIGETGQREIYGIQSILPREWQPLMSWPLRAMHEKFDMKQKNS